MKQKANLMKAIFISWIVFIAVYNVGYGAFCYAYGGIEAVIFGMCMMLGAGISGLLIAKYFKPKTQGDLKSK